MAVNPYVNKVQLADGTTLIDLTEDDVTPSEVISGRSFHLATGQRTVGSYDPTSIIDDNASSGETNKTWSANKLVTEMSRMQEAPTGAGVAGQLLGLDNSAHPVWITPANNAEEDNTRPITAGAVYTEIGNINALLATI